MGCDAHLHLKGIELHPFLPQELALGDGHYRCLDHFITPFPEPPNGHLTDRQYLINVIITHYRSRVEHVNRKIEHHGIFQQRFRGGIRLLNSAIQMVCHTTNIELYRKLAYSPVGPWPHFHF